MRAGAAIVSNCKRSQIAFHYTTITNGRMRVYAHRVRLAAGSAFGSVSAAWPAETAHDNEDDGQICLILLHEIYVPIWRYDAVTCSHSSADAVVIII